MLIARPERLSGGGDYNYYTWDYEGVFEWQFLGVSYALWHAYRCTIIMCLCVHIVLSATAAIFIACCCAAVAYYNNFSLAVFFLPHTRILH